METAGRAKRNFVMPRSRDWEPRNAPKARNRAGWPTEHTEATERREPGVQGRPRLAAGGCPCSLSPDSLRSSFPPSAPVGWFGSGAEVAKFLSSVVAPFCLFSPAIAASAAPPVDAGRSRGQRLRGAAIAFLSASARRRVGDGLACAARLPGRRSRRQVLPRVPPLRGLALGNGLRRSGVALPRSRDGGGCFWRRTGTDRSPHAVRRGGMDCRAHAGRRLPRQSAGSFPALRGSHERAASRATRLARVGLLGAHEVSASGFARRSSSPHRGAGDGSDQRGASTPRLAGRGGTFPSGSDAGRPVASGRRRLRWFRLPGVAAWIRPG